MTFLPLYSFYILQLILPFHVAESIFNNVSLKSKIFRVCEALLNATFMLHADVYQTQTRPAHTGTLQNIMATPLFGLDELI